ncbi:hypothetical protein NPS01_42770 [Nocardioides psychrotolerans]|uniref:Phage-related protein n=1 Tax=Nocardioides psychrotolerans TaxID=1005945 RepID=A0A1I3MA58_9ACTN|nr:hypothetical protein [Nocardioides psychrotolerans]GEP40614.1 hypothetical protein NPS01_42770 [Nocardioides psychrotolerans]SFI93871.1 hypothetical protein SAMN05216561_11527 [Nocardioides psychrotolerans]
MGGAVALAIKVSADAKSATAELDQATQTTSKLGTAGKAAGRLLAAGLLLAVGAAIKFTAAAAEDAQAQAKLAQTAKQVAGATDEQVSAMESWIAAQGRSKGIADDQLRPAMSKLLTVTNDVGKSQKLASLAMDISARTGKSLESVTQGLAKAQTGSVAGLSKYGVQTKDVEGKTRSLAAVQGDLAKLYGGAAAAAADTAAGKQKILAVQMDELQESIGTKLLPVMLKLTSAGLAVVDWITQNQEVALAIIGVLGGLLAIIKAVSVAQQAWSAVMKVVAAAQWLLNAAMAANPIGLVVIAIIALVAVFVIAYKKSETFRDIVNGAFDAVKSVVSGVIDWFRTAVPAAWETVRAKTVAAWGAVVDFIKAIPSKLVSAFMNFTLPGLIIKHWDDIKSKTSAAWGAVVDFVKGIPGKLVGFFLTWTLPGLFIKHWDDLKSGTIRVATSVVDWVAGLPGKIIGRLSSLGSMLLEVGSSAFGRLRSGAEEKAGALLEYVRGIPGRVKNTLSNLGSLLLSAGSAIIQGLIDGIQSKIGEVTSMLQGLTDKIPDWKGPAGRDSRLLHPAGRLIMDGLVRGIQDGSAGVEKVLGRVTALIEKALAKRYDGKELKARIAGVAAGIAEETKALERNGQAQDRVTAALERGRAKLQEIRDTARQYAASIVESYASFGSVVGLGQGEDGAVSLGGIFDQLKDRVKDAQRFTEVVQQLTGAGLNQTTLQQLIGAGVDGALATAEALASGGSAAVAQVNRMTEQIEAAGASLGKSAAADLYGAGIKAAQGLVEGLEKRAKELDAVADRLAGRIVSTVLGQLNDNRDTLTQSAGGSDLAIKEQTRALSDLALVQSGDLRALADEVSQMRRENKKAPAETSRALTQSLRTWRP